MIMFLTSIYSFIRGLIRDVYKRQRRSMPATVPVKVFLTPAAAGSGSFLNGEDYEMIDFNPNNCLLYTSRFHDQDPCEDKEP